MRSDGFASFATADNVQMVARKGDYILKEALFGVRERLPSYRDANAHVEHD